MTAAPQTGRQRAGICVLSLLVVIYAVRVTSYWHVAPIELARVKATHVSSETRTRLARLGEGVLITYYVTDRARMPSHMRGVERGVTAILDALREASGGRLDYQRVDPDGEPGLQDYAARRGVAPFRARSVERDAWSERTVWSALSVASAERRESVINGIGPEHLSRLQVLLLDHLSQINAPRRPVVALSRSDGFSALAAELSTRADVVIADLSQGRAPPDNIDLLFWLDPDGRASELRAVDAFVARGRSVVVAGSDMRVTLGDAGGDLEVSFQPAQTDLEAALAHFGLRPVPGLVLDASAAEVSRAGIPAPFLIRSVPSSHDFRSLRGQPNGALLFLAPTPIALDGPRLDARGWTADVLVTTSDRTSITEVPATTIPVRSLTAGQGEPAPKLPLAVLLRPTDPWKGLVVAFGATTPFADGFFDAAGAAHAPLLRTLLDNLASPERLALHRAGVVRAAPLSELALVERLSWRLASVLFLPVLLAAVAFARRDMRAAPPTADAIRPIWRLALGAVVGVVVIAAGVRVLTGADWRADLSRDALNELAPHTRAIASRMRDGRAVRAEVRFSPAERLPPAMRPGLAQLLDILRELGRAGAEISIARVRPEDLSAEERGRLGIERVTVSDNVDGVTTVRTVYASLRLTSGTRSEVLDFSEAASFENLEFRLAFALTRLDTGMRPRIAFASDTPRLTPAEAHEQYQTQQLIAPSGTDVYSVARQLLKEVGFEVTHVDVRDPTPPAPADVLVWLQPRRPMERLLNTMIRHLHAGGRVLLAAQHFNMQARQYQGAGFRFVYWPQPQWPEIDELYLPGLGIHLVREVLFDELSTAMPADTQVNRGVRPEIDRQISTLPFVVRASAAQFARDSRITKGLGDQAFVWGSYIRWDPSRLRELGLRVTPLITTSDHTWSYAWTGGWIPEEVFTGPPRGDRGEPRWLGRQALAMLVEGTFPLQVVRRQEDDLAGEPAGTADASDIAGGPPTTTAPRREGTLLLMGGSELFKNHRLRTPEFRADHLLLNAVATLALDDELAAVASRRFVARGFGYLEPSARLFWRAVVVSMPVVFLIGVALARRLGSQGSMHPQARA